MPFKPNYFQQKVDLLVPWETRNKMIQLCQSLTQLTTPRQKAQCIKEMMEILDREVDLKARIEIMEECGRYCIGRSTLEKALHLKKVATDLDDLLFRLNQEHIGGGLLRREGKIINAQYERCYCGSVSKTRELFSSTYCHCSCGWFKQLFETLLIRPVTVELKTSIIQGDNNCQFEIHIQSSNWIR